jgi:tripartite-type tricarboxylate transporter receptor subunit TctC
VHNSIRKFFVSTALAATACITSGAANAQAWPSKPVYMMVPASAGGSLDTLARPLAAKLSQLSGQQFIVENRGGAGGVIGADVVAKAPADGSRFLFGAVHHMIAPHVIAKMPYDTAKDLLPVTMVATVPNVVVVNANSGIQSIADLIREAKKPNSHLNYGTGGAGTLHHLTAERFKQVTGAQLEAIHYKGSGPALTDLLGGQINVMFETMPSALGHINSGKFRALAVTSAARSPMLLNVPTLAEERVPGVTVTTWYGIFAPAGLPADITARMVDLVSRALATPELQAVWKSYGAAPGGNSSAEFGEFVKTELTRWGAATKSAGLKPE